MSYYTYLHLKADTKEVFYVGKGKADRGRANSHLNRSLYWHNTVAKHGLLVMIAANWQNEEDAYEHEKFLIACFVAMRVALVNLTQGGDGVRGLRHSDEFRAWQAQKVRMEFQDKARKAAHGESQRRRFSSDEARKQHGIKIQAGWTPEKRAAAAERTRRMILEKGHPRQKITDEMLDEIERMRSSGVMMKDAAAHFGISRTQANKAKIRRDRIRSAHPSLKVFA